ncbi:hypothetical protein FIBSPDRAFT_861493 [Athelia psychrophila]|uniref:Uncharacterized protein n=1 Tax=Athelia psychrophila TaxID=1759441 RepID=A0A166J4A2_9AGAM|nr:hypothetical protein FIBSPDRAFT_861493 [Fibularhizoctonia sp. CBS 109695]
MPVTGALGLTHAWRNQDMNTVSSPRRCEIYHTVRLSCTQHRLRVCFQTILHLLQLQQYHYDHC